MRNAMPTRWFEEAESTADAGGVSSERNAVPARRRVTKDAASPLPRRLLSWLATRHPISWPISPTRLH